MTYVINDNFYQIDSKINWAFYRYFFRLVLEFSKIC